MYYSTTDLQMDTTDGNTSIYDTVKDYTQVSTYPWFRLTLPTTKPTILSGGLYHYYYLR